MTGQGRRVLILEDDYFVAADIANELAARGVEVVGPVATIADALAIIRLDENLHGALVDINLAGQMAFAVADELIARGVPLAFTTGYDQAAIPERYNAVPRQVKPLDRDAIGRALAEIDLGPSAPAL
jgi:ActR/RegA family two-component response regulator